MAPQTCITTPTSSYPSTPNPSPHHPTKHWRHKTKCKFSIKTTVQHKTPRHMFRKLYCLPLLQPSLYLNIWLGRQTPSQIENMVTNHSLHNLSSNPFLLSKIKLLSLGLYFIPPPHPINKQKLIESVSALDRTYCLRFSFRNSTKNLIPPFRIPNPHWNPNWTTHKPNYYNCYLFPPFTT